MSDTQTPTDTAPVDNNSANMNNVSEPNADVAPAGTPTVQPVAPKQGIDALVDRAQNVQQHTATQLQQQYVQPQNFNYQQPAIQYGGGAPETQGYTQIMVNQAMQAQQAQLLAENQQYLQAAMEHPELQKSHPDYDQSFDDAVYMMWKQLSTRDNSVTMAEVATRFKADIAKRVEKEKQKAREAAEKQIALKVQGSAGRQVRSGVSENTSSELKAAYDRAMQTKSSQDWIAYNTLKKRYNK